MQQSLKAFKSLNLEISYRVQYLFNMCIEMIYVLSSAFNNALTIVARLEDVLTRVVL